MKVSDQMRFPHPVLWSRTSDYVGAEFGIALEVSEDTDSGRVHLKCEVHLTEPEIQKLCGSGAAAIGVSVVCLETYYNRLLEVPLAGGEIDVGAGQLRGHVTIRPVIWATRQVTCFVSANVHDEFGVGSLSFEKYDILAFGDEAAINVGKEKLARIGSVFALASDDSVEPDEIDISIDGEKVEIVSNSKTHERLIQLRNTARGQTILLGSVYFPVVMTVVDTIRRNDAAYEQKHWYRVISAKLTSLGISLENMEPLEVAQRLLKSPLRKLDAFVEYKK